MEYHQPDGTWSVFSINDYKTYLTHFLVKGQFHPCVPKDVSDSFLSAEHIMAHAYYHYPLYDEAASKVLRIIEMAVKMRCNQLNISLVTKYLNKKTGLPYDKALKNLMDDLTAAEPIKALDWQLDHSRKLRNNYMHPDSHKFSGGLSRNFIRRSVTLLNKLFLPETFFTPNSTHLNSVVSQIAAFTKGPTVLLFNSNKYLVYNVALGDCLQVDGAWLYCLYAQPIVLNIVEEINNHSYAPAFLFTVKDLVLEQEKITATDIGSGTTIELHTTNHPHNTLLYDNFINNIQSTAANDLRWYDYNCQEELAKQIGEFQYSWLWKCQ